MTHVRADHELVTRVRPDHELVTRVRLNFVHGISVLSALYLVVTRPFHARVDGELTAS